MSDFKGVSEKFRVSLVHSDGQTERVVVQIGLDGLKVLSADSSRALKNFDLSHISRWQSRGSSLVLYTKTPVDVEERQLTLQGDDHTIRSALDTLTCCCMQLVELLQTKKTDTAQETANNLHALVAGGGKKKMPTALPHADEIEYWRSPDKAGWLQCQGEVMKSWRKRWFVLKQGHLFRFMNDKVTESSKPRGVVDLSKVQDIKPANAITGRGNSIQLKTTSGGSVCYIADSETEVVEWISAVESAMARICKHVAGEEDPPASAQPAPSSSKRSAGSSSTSSAQAEWAKQLERNFASMANVSSRNGSERDRGVGGGSSGRDKSSAAVVNIVGYESVGGSTGGGGSSSSRSRDTYSSKSPYAALAQQFGSGIEYSQIAGAGVVGKGSSNSTALDELALNYGTNQGGSSGGYGSQQYGQPPASSSTSYGGPSYGAGQAYQPQQQPQQSQPSYQHPYGAPPYNSAPSSFEQLGGSGASVYGAIAAPSYDQQGGGYGAGSGSGYGAPPAVMQSQPSGGSLIDQVPHQQPAYPYFQHSASAPQQHVQQPPQVQAAAAGTWQSHYTPEGRPYYYNAALGTTQWDAPVGYAT